MRLSRLCRVTAAMLVAAPATCSRIVMIMSHSPWRSGREMSVGEFDMCHCIIHSERASSINIEPHSARVNAGRAGPFSRSAVTSARHECPIFITTLFIGRSIYHQDYTAGRCKHDGDFRRSMVICTSRNEDIFGASISNDLLTAM
jgi:hypothetical protein